MPTAPPRLARWILHVALPRGARGDTVRGDLFEEFGARSQTSPIRARRWYWRQTLAIAARSAIGRTVASNENGQDDHTANRGSAGLMDIVLVDLRSATKALIKARGFTIASVVTLALGIGAAIAVFSVVEAVLVRPLPFTDPARVMWMSEVFADTGAPMGISWPDFLDWRQRLHAYSDLAGIQPTTFNLTGGEMAERVEGRRVTWTFLHTLGVHPQMGRDFAESDDRFGAAPVVLVSDGFWRTHLAANPGAIGQRVAIDGISTVVIGVLPRGFRYNPLTNDAFYVSLGASASDDSGLPDRGNHNNVSAVGRLKAGMTEVAARRELADVEAALRREHPDTNAVVAGQVIPVTDRLANGVGPVIATLFGAVAVLLLLAAVNVASLAVARGVSRRQEMALRAALGCGRRRLVGYLITENLLVALAGGFAGLGVADALIRALVAAAPPNIPRLDEVGLDAGVWLFALGASVVIALLIAMLPGLQASSARSQEALVRASRDDLGAASGHRARRGLMVVEVALAVVLLTGAGLMARTLHALTTVDPGFNPAHLLTLRFSIDGDRSTPAAVEVFDRRVVAFYDQLLPSLQALPGVVAAGAAPSLPIDGANWNSIFVVRGQPVPARALLPSAAFVPATPDLFTTLGIRLKAGRVFTTSDTHDTASVAIVNEQFVRKFLPGLSPVGQRFKQGWPETPGAWREIVGVVNDVKLNGLEQDTPPEVYLPMAQEPASSSALVVRTAGDPAVMLPAVRGAFTRLDPMLPLFDVHTMDDLVKTDLARQRLTMLILVGFATLALLLASVGLYGVVSHGVSARTREIGVRIALGASGRQVVSLFVGQGLVTTAVGLATGAAAGVAMARFVESQGLLFHVTARDPVTFSVAIVTLFLISVGACYVPARRASRVDPLVTLRGE
jgi:putative ABC transport system permease protein